jgi:hypothetical protein
MYRCSKGADLSSSAHAKINLGSKLVKLQNVTLITENTLLRSEEGLSGPVCGLKVIRQFERRPLRIPPSNASPIQSAWT